MPTDPDRLVTLIRFLVVSALIEQQVFYALKKERIFEKSIIFWIFWMFIHHSSKFGKFSLKIGGIFFFKVYHFLICFHNLHIVQWLPVVPFTCSNGLFTVAACCKITNIVGNPKQEMGKCFWSQIQVTKSNKSKVTNGRWAKLQIGITDYERSE